VYPEGREGDLSGACYRVHESIGAIFLAGQAQAMLALAWGMRLDRVASHAAVTATVAGTEMRPLMDIESSPDAVSKGETAEPSDFTRLLQAHAAGDPSALHQLMPRVYDELRGMARGRMRGERPDHTLGGTDLVHEAFMRLLRLDRIAWRNRAHFLAIASQAMRHVLLDHHRAGKRGGGIRAVTLDRLSIAGTERDDAVIALCEALDELERVAPRQARVVECRFFAGLSIDETAAALGISPATVSREWTVARAWLHAQLDATTSHGAS